MKIVKKVIWLSNQNTAVTFWERELGGGYWEKFLINQAERH